jgi:hypothetical protein
VEPQTGGSDDGGRLPPRTRIDADGLSGSVILTLGQGVAMNCLRRGFETFGDPGPGAIEQASIVDRGFPIFMIREQVPALCRIFGVDPNSPEWCAELIDASNRIGYF